MAAAVRAGLPTGTFDLCCQLALATAALVEGGTGRPVHVSETAVAAQLRLPEVMAASYGSGNFMRPAAPVAAPGGGWYHADLGAPGDDEAFDIMRSTLPPEYTARELAEEAQAWRLPVCDYREPEAAEVPGSPAAPTAGGQVEAFRPLSQAVVCDLTSMWAGPLATWVLAGLGATVHKVEPARRLDGFRAIDGKGIHPGGPMRLPGADSGMWNALNRGKTIEDIDLASADGRRRFVDLAASCHLIIDSWSPRVWPNFGLQSDLAALGARPAHLSIPAFPPGPMRSWVAYGTGVHAVSGLGQVGPGRWEAPAVSYPDPVGGFTAALAAVDLLMAAHTGVRLECSLLDALRPLIDLAVAHGDRGCSSELGDAGREAEVGPALLAELVRVDAVEWLTVGDTALAHPLPPIRA